MYKGIKEKWIKALRSGRYKQTTGILCDRLDGGYCCLGVLARIQGAKKDEIYHRGALQGEDLDKYAAGLRLRSQDKLAGMNDVGWNFNMIADYIEKHYK